MFFLANLKKRQIIKKKSKKPVVGDSIKNIVVREGIFADVMLGKSHAKDPKHDIELVNFKKTADNTTFFCKVCQKVWEYEFHSYRIKGKKTKINYYSNIPKYKKKKKVCDYCEKKV